MTALTELLARAATIAAEYRAAVGEHPVGRPVDMAALRAGFDPELQDERRSAAEVLDELVASATPGLVATAGPRYFGFVTGGALDAATAADLVAVGWDQNAFNQVLSPAAAMVEERAGGWVKELLGLPAHASVGFVTGGQEANTVGLAAARHHVLEQAGWDVATQGLHGGTRVRIVANIERHATIDRAVRLLGLGTSTIESVASGPNGVIDVDDLRAVLERGASGPLIVCLQAGNVNTGACDDLGAAIDLAKAHGAWVHVDGAFGLWAAAAPSTRHQVSGVERADSWGCDAHKWLNVPYDSGFAICAHPATHAAAVSYTAAYLVGSGGLVNGPSDYTLESSRRARGFAVWAALRELGRHGVAELVERHCAQARRFAAGIAAHGAEIANDVVLNQVLVGFGDDARTDAVIAGVQSDGTCWMGGTTWRGRRYMRVSVSNWTTTDADIDRSVEAVARVAGLA